MTAGEAGSRGPELTRLMGQSLRYLPSRVVPALLGLLTVPLLARALSPSGFGSYSLVAAALPYACVVAGDWLVAGFQRQAQRRAVEEEAQALTWLLVVSLSGTVLLVVTAAAGGPPEALGVALLLVPFLLLRLQWIQLQMHERATAYTRLQVAYSAVRLLSVGGVAVLTTRADYVVLAWVLATWLVVLLGPRLPLPRRPDGAALRRLAAVGLPLVGASFTINLTATADRFIIASLLGRDVAGVYSLGYMVGESLLTLPASVVYLAAYAVITRLWDGGDREVGLALVRRLIRVQLMVTTPIAMLIALAGAPIVSIVGGEPYASAADIVGTVAGAQVAAGIPAYLILVATLRRETRLTLWSSVIASLVNVVLTVPAVLIAGLQGAAMATVVTYLLYAMLLLKKVGAALLTRAQVVALVLGTVAPGLVSLGGAPLVWAGFLAATVATLLFAATLTGRGAIV